MPSEQFVSHGENKLQIDEMMSANCQLYHGENKLQINEKMSVTGLVSNFLLVLWFPPLYMYN